MTDRTLRVLEFTKIREMLQGYAISNLGAEKAAQLEPENRLDRVRVMQEETEEAHVLLTYLGDSPLISFEDVSQALKLSEVGSTLSPRALLDIAALMRASRVGHDALVTDRENTPRLTAMARNIAKHHRLENDITAAILSEEEIADHASPALADIRRHIRAAGDRVREKLNSLIHSATFAKYLQEQIITIRNDRYVVPVKQEFRAQVPGLIHDQSATGATLFVEPMAVVEIGNDLKQWRAKEKNEIERILQAFSAQVAPEAPALRNNADLLAHLDFCFAKAALSRSMSGVAPKLNSEGVIRIVRGRHPLIDPEKVVPSDIWLGETFTTLVITGPNTGGKTVTLKTIGLLALMAQAGLHVPADLGTQLSVFDQVFADIGDEQSIEQSLSTFSSHMTNIVGILEEVTPNSLALFDELGAGTDPTEGAALAQVILSCLLEGRTRTVATTHYAELKAYALSTPGVENASVEFDIRTLQPTYRLSIGIPGKSNAFEISRKLGLPEALIDQARELLSKEQIRFEDVIADAEYHRQIARKERELAEQARDELVQMREEADQQRKKLAAQQDAATRKAKEQAKRILEDARRESEQIIAELKRLKKQGQVTPEHEVQKLKQRLGEGIDAVSDALVAPVERVSTPPKDLKPGERVRIVHLGTDANVLTPPDAKGEVQLQAGLIKLKAHLSQLQRAGIPEEKPKTQIRNRVDVLGKAVAQEVDVRGLALDEALAEVDKFLDDAVLSSLGEVNIIHGKGTGALRSGISTHLRKHPHVESYRLGRYGEGETGVTVVTLKK